MEDTQENGDDLFSILVKEEYVVKEEDVQFTEEGDRTETLLDTSLDCHECGTTHRNIQCLLRHLAHRHGGLVTEIPDSLSTPTLHSVTNIKEEQTDELEETPNLKILSRSTKSIKTPQPRCKKFECDKCGAKLTYQDSFIRHYREVHLRIKKYKCKQCNKMYKRNSGLQKHMESHSNKWHSCEICNKVFKGPIRLKKHIKTHAVVKKFECDKCGAKLTYQGSFIRHYREIHLGTKTYKCKQCKKIFKRNSRLKKHLKTPCNKTLECNKCGENFRNSWSLMSHLASCHGGLVTEISDSLTSVKEEPTNEVEVSPDLKIPFGSAMNIIETPLPRCKNFECDICGAKLTYQASFIRHYREVHLGIRNFKCEQCKKIFKRNSALKKHLKSHKMAYKGPMRLKKYIKTRAVKKFKCEECGVKLMHQDSLIRHYKEVHLRMKSYKCNQCEKIYKRNSVLKRHMKTHSNNSLESLECHECGKTYRYARCLLGHLANSHGSLVTEISDSFSTYIPPSVTNTEEHQSGKVS